MNWEWELCGGCTLGEQTRWNFKTQSFRTRVAFQYRAQRYLWSDAIDHCHRQVLLCDAHQQVAQRGCVLDVKQLLVSTSSCRTLSGLKFELVVASKSCDVTTAVSTSRPRCRSFAPTAGSCSNSLHRTLRSSIASPNALNIHSSNARAAYSSAQSYRRCITVKP